MILIDLKHFFEFKDKLLSLTSLEKLSRNSKNISGKMKRNDVLKLEINDWKSPHVVKDSILIFSHFHALFTPSFFPFTFPPPSARRRIKFTIVRRNLFWETGQVRVCSGEKKPEEQF